jgi:RNA polymerase sigma-70 factor (ECF subfamily)
MTNTPVSLLERLRDPFDCDAWARFVKLYTPLIYSWGRRVGLQDQDAVDLVQDVFATLIQVLPTFAYDRHKSFRGWLRTVALNRWRNTRKQWNEKMPREPGNGVERLALPDDVEAFWEAEYQQHLVSQALAIMRADFQEKTWRACWEVVVSGRSANEVAKELGLSIGAVYAAKFRVLDRLRRELRGMLE